MEPCIETRSLLVNWKFTCKPRFSNEIDHRTGPGSQKPEVYKKAEDNVFRADIFATDKILDRLCKESGLTVVDFLRMEDFWIALKILRISAQHILYTVQYCSVSLLLRVKIAFFQFLKAHKVECLLHNFHNTPEQKF